MDFYAHNIDALDSFEFEAKLDISYGDLTLVQDDIDNAKSIFNEVDIWSDFDSYSVTATQKPPLDASFNEGGGNGGEDVVIATGSTEDGGNSIVSFLRSLGSQAFQLADLNNDGDLWEEAAGALALIGIGLLTGGTGWVATVGAASSGSGVILGGFSFWEDSQDNTGTAEPIYENPDNPTFWDEPSFW